MQRLVIVSADYDKYKNYVDANALEIQHTIFASRYVDVAGLDPDHHRYIVLDKRPADFDRMSAALQHIPHA